MALPDSEPTVRLGYWDIRGYAEPIRLMLHYKNIAYEFETFEMDSRGELHPDWQMKKSKLDIPFPNLPYYIDEDVSLSQTSAIIRYLARKHDLGGRTDEEEAEIDAAAEAIKTELHFFLLMTCYSDQFEILKQISLAQAKDVFQRFEKLLSKEGKHWLFGDRITYPDFHLWSMLDSYLILDPTVLDGMGKLQNYKAMFEQVPAVKEYISRKEFNRYQICHTNGVFCGDGKPPTYN